MLDIRKLLELRVISVLLISFFCQFSAGAKNIENRNYEMFDQWEIETNFLNLNLQSFQVFSSSQNLKTNSPPSSVKIAVNKSDNLIYLAEFKGENKILAFKSTNKQLLFSKELKLPNKYKEYTFDETQILDLHYSDQGGGKGLYVSVAYSVSKPSICKILIVYKINNSLQKINSIFSSYPCSVNGEMDGRIGSNEDYIFLTRCLENSNSFNHILRISKSDNHILKISKGHRRAQGLVWDPDRHILFETEQGPRGGDELNIIENGKDYGWPYVSLGRWYTKDMIKNPPVKYNNHDNYEEPIYAWLPSIGISQLTIIPKNSLFKEWKKDIIVSSLKDQSLYRLRLTKYHSDNTYHVLYAERINLGYRIRDLESDKGHIYATTDDGKIIIISLDKSKVSENPFPPVDFTPTHKAIIR